MLRNLSRPIKEGGKRVIILLEANSLFDCSSFISNIFFLIYFRINLGIFFPKLNVFQLSDGAVKLKMGRLDRWRQSAMKHKVSFLCQEISIELKGITASVELTANFCR